MGQTPRSELLFISEKHLRTPFGEDCQKCARRLSDQLREAGHFVESLLFRMYVCPSCGDKRCSKAKDHEQPCDKAGKS
ncbi:hypothetical protein A4X17_11370 [Plantibacter sp. H53]|uniref:hypothetical protein n=1 Tax=Plantibacter sp. H53 TaxID=1827323 RepID=UPI0007DA2D47|nr:hypothetical protein [Plantibacter sp. H53]OAN35074.1 hypothetical protein A4X17_11370 [Plantibacter sp. H53]